MPFKIDLLSKHFLHVYTWKFHDGFISVFLASCSPSVNVKTPWTLELIRNPIREWPSHSHAPKIPWKMFSPVWHDFAKISTPKNVSIFTMDDCTFFHSAYFFCSIFNSFIQMSSKLKDNKGFSELNLEANHSVFVLINVRNLYCCHGTFISINWFECSAKIQCWLLVWHILHLQRDLQTLNESGIQFAVGNIGEEWWIYAWYI